MQGGRPPVARRPARSDKYLAPLDPVVMPAVTLDLWHTLIFLRPEDEEEYMETQIRLATAALERAEPLPGVPVAADGALRRAFEEVYAQAVTEAGRGRTVTPVEQLRRAGERTGRRPRAEEYLRDLRSVVERLPFEKAPGGIDFLRSLAEDGYRLGVISNTVGEPGAFLRPALEKMGFDAFVRAYVFSDELPWTKPAPEIFRTTLERLGERPDAAVHVGDGWSDIEGARRAGMRGGILFTGLQDYGARYKALFLPEGWDRPSTEYVADRLDRVRELVRRLLPPARGG